MVAQAAAAAMRTVTDGKAMHSMHSYFMRPVDIGAPVTYEVEVLRDGRGYATRQVRAFQNGKAAYTCLASFAAGEPGGRYAASAPADVAGTGLAAQLRGIPARPRAGRGLDDDGGVEGVLVRRAQLRHAARPRPGLPRGRRWLGPTAPAGLVGQAVRRAATGRRAHRRAARPGRAGLRLRLHDPRAGAAGARPALGPAGTGHRQPRPRDVVPPAAGAAASSTAGCSTRRRRWPPTPVAAWASAASSPPTASTSRPSCRKA